MGKILHLEENDDITAIRSRIEIALPELMRQAAQSGQPTPERLLLVVPRKNKALHSLVNLKLLARLVRGRSVELGVVSSHPVIRDHAKAAGLKTFSSLRMAKWSRWITDQTDVIPTAKTELPVASAEANLTGGSSSKPKKARVKKKKYRVVEGDKGPNKLQLTFQQVGLLILVVVLAAVFVLGAIALLPEATITITPVAKPVEAELIVKADPDITSVDFQELTFPARIDQVELALAGEIETVETELAPVGRASGRVIFINRTEDPQSIPISTTVVSSAGEPVEFTTVQSATIPAGVGATSRPIRVVATEPGPRGNVQVAQINRFENSAYGLVARVVNEEPMFGGALEPARIVEEADKERLTAYLRQQIQQEGLNQLQERLGEQEFIPPQSVQVIVLDVDYREFSGDFSDVFGGEIQAVVRATVVGGYNANRLALAALEAQVPPGFELDLDGLNFGAGEVLDIQDRVVSFKIFASGQAVPVINDRVIAKDIAGLSIGDAQSLLEQQYALATVPGVDLKPSWLVDRLGRLPFSSLRIDVVINEAVTLVADGS